MPEPKITYGPSQSRSSRTPIIFKDFDNPQQSGEFRYIPPSPLNFFGHPAEAWSGQPVQEIQVSPNSVNPESVTNTIRHESIHALLQALGRPGRLAASEDPNFSTIAQSLLQARRGGNLSEEAPAYSLSNDKSINFDPSIQMAFNQGFLHQVQSLDPKVAKALQGIQQRSQ